MRGESLTQFRADFLRCDRIPGERGIHFLGARLAFSNPRFKAFERTFYDACFSAFSAQSEAIRERLDASVQVRSVSNVDRQGSFFGIGRLEPIVALFV